MKNATNELLKAIEEARRLTKLFSERSNLEAEIVGDFVDPASNALYTSLEFCCDQVINDPTADH